MYVDAFFTKLALRKVGTIFLGMEVCTFFIREVAIRVVPAFDLLFICRSVSIDLLVKLRLFSLLSQPIFIMP